MPLSAPEYWLEWTKNYFRCQFTHVGELIHRETWSAASFGWAEGLQMINPPIYRLTTAVSDIDQTNINRYIRDGNWLSIVESPKYLKSTARSIAFRIWMICFGKNWPFWQEISFCAKKNTSISPILMDTNLGYLTLGYFWSFLRSGAQII